MPGIIEKTTLLLSLLLCLRHMMFLSRYQPYVLDLLLAMLQGGCQYSYLAYGGSSNACVGMS